MLFAENFKLSITMQWHQSMEDEKESKNSAQSFYASPIPIKLKIHFHTSPSLL